MLKLSESQVEAFRRQSESQFVDRLAAQLHADLEAAGRQGPDLDALKVAAKAMLDKARALGFDTEAQVAQFAGTMVIELEMTNTTRLPPDAFRLLRDGRVNRYERLDRFQIWATTERLNKRS